MRAASAVLVSLSFAASALPQPVVTAVTNAASFTTAVSPGALSTLWGTELAVSEIAAVAFPLPTSLAGISVTVNGSPAPLLYVSPGQINFQVPSAVSPGAAAVVVTNSSGSSEAFPFALIPAAPAIFELDQGRAAALNLDGTVNGAENPQSAGGFVSVFLTGQGPLSGAVEDGTEAPDSPLSTATLAHGATIGGQNAEVQFLGLAPGFAGLAQANLKVPELPTGDYPVILNVDGEPSAAAAIAVSGQLPATAAPPIDTGAGPWLVSTAPTTPVPMDDLTVFAFSQANTNERDPQVIELKPDIDIRAWQRWDRGGTAAADYDFNWVRDFHAAGIRFIGGSTATVAFRDEVSTDAQFRDWASRDASGNLVDHSEIVPGAHRASLANPSYRAYLIGIGKLQIDGGVDGLFFDEVNSVSQGAGYNGNEGFDDYHLADFNAYLLAKYPPPADFRALFGMTPDNLLRRDLPQGDLVRNFNYREYLAARGWSAAPYAPANPLASEWKRATGNRVPPGAPDFLNAADPYRYWKQIVRELREYAWRTRRRKILVTSNGIFPYVDFQSVGLYDYNPEGVDWCPVRNGHLDGSRSLQSAMLGLKAQSERVAPGVPVVLFLDWPTPLMDRYNALPFPERQDYWRMYAAEAYANGLFFAFHLRTTTGEPTATQAGVMPLFKSLAAFYRAHAGFYHGVTPSTVRVSPPIANVMVSVTDQAAPARRFVHFVNHAYSNGFTERIGFEVTIPSDAAPRSVALASPDQPQDRDLPFTYSDGLIRIAIPSLIAYDILAISY